MLYQLKILLYYTVILLVYIGIIIVACYVLCVALQATLLVLHPSSGKLLVNFDPKISEIVRETKCMLKMGLEVPEQALRLVKNEKSMEASRLRLEVLKQACICCLFKCISAQRYYDVLNSDKMVNV